MNKRLDLIPKISSDEVRQKHIDNIECWKFFARKFQKNPYVRTQVLVRDSYKCQFCGCRLSVSNNFHVHHVDYDHTCKFGKTISIPSPTEKRPNRAYNGPDCKACHIEKPSLFSECMSRVVLVHPLCNKEIEESRVASEKRALDDF